MNSAFTAPALALLVGYVLGSIPFGLILTRITGAGDLRSIGSGSIGATNVLRTGRKGLAAATLALDALKGSVAVLVGQYLGDGLGVLSGLAAFIGHLYPVWLAFRGGKGVATMFGVVITLSRPCGVAFALIWLGTILGSRVSSLGGMAAAISAPVIAALVGRFDLVIVLLVMGMLVIWRHRENISRLLSGDEPRIGQRTAAGPPAPADVTAAADLDAD